MPFSTAALKASAKRIISQSKPNAVAVGAVYCALSILLSLLSSRLMNSNMSISRYQQMLEHIENGNLDYAARLAQDMMPSGGAIAIYILLSLSLSVVSMGFLIFLLRTVRGDSPSYGNLLDGFGFFWRIILLEIVTNLLVGLWSLLLVIPGIIAAYRYCLAPYLLIDHPEYSVMDCIRESKRMMAGHKMERFILELSFFGWLLLTSLSSTPGLGLLALVQIWTVPYMNMCYTLYYERLRTGGTAVFLPFGGDQEPPLM